MTMHGNGTEMAEDDEPGKLFIGGLSWETTQEKLSDYFSKFGDLSDCVIIKNMESGQSRGFGFVTFKDPKTVSKVLGGGPHELDNRTIDPKVCKVSLKQGKKGGSPKIFMGGLPPDCTETDIRAFFSRYGTVDEVVLMYDQEKKKPRGFGFLSFESEESVKQVCAEHFVKINGKKVECKAAQPRAKNSMATQNQQPSNQWGAQGMSGPGNCGPPAPPSGPMPGPAYGGWQGGWGPQYGPQGGPQGGWGPPPQQGYGPGYQNWGPGYGPYGGPGPNYGQNYGGYGGPGGYGNYNNNAGGGPNNNSNYSGPPGGGNGPQSGPGPQTAGDCYSGPGQSASGGPQGNQQPVQQSGQTGMGNYQQDNSNYGPSRGYGGYGTGPGNNYNSGGNYSGSSSENNSSGRPMGGSGGTGYHPYRR